MEKTDFALQPSTPFTSCPDIAEPYMAFEVSDDSMSDGSCYSYEPCDIIIGSLIHHHRWQQEIQPGLRDFILLHRSRGALLRRISHREPATGTLTLHPLNPGYRDWDIDIGEVTEIYHVIKIERTKA